MEKAKHVIDMLIEFERNAEDEGVKTWPPLTEGIFKGKPVIELEVREMGDKRD